MSARTIEPTFAGPTTNDQTDLLATVARETAGQAEAAKPQVADQLQAVTTDLRRAQEAADRYLSAFESGTMPAGVCGPRLEALEERIVELRGRQADLEAELQQSTASVPTRQPFTDMVKLIRDAIEDDESQRERKPLLRALVADIRVD
jgi:site-specific DNA recombinase